MHGVMGGDEQPWQQGRPEKCTQQHTMSQANAKKTFEHMDVLPAREQQQLLLLIVPSCSFIFDNIACCLDQQRREKLAERCSCRLLTNALLGVVVAT
jgi:hypothetical protein